MEITRVALTRSISVIKEVITREIASEGDPSHRSPIKGGFPSIICVVVTRRGGAPIVSISGTNCLAVVLVVEKKG